MQTCSTSTSSVVASSSAVAAARSAPSSRAAASLRCGVEAATATSVAPARRAERAWMLPIMPVPATATRSGGLLSPSMARHCVTYVERRQEFW